MATQNITYSAKRSQFLATLTDLKEGLLRWPLWMSFAWEDLRDRYKRSYIGILWQTFSFAIFIGVKVLIFGRVANASPEYFAVYVTLGLFVWTFISTNFTDGCAVFWNAEAWIKGVRLPLSLFVYQSLARILYIMLYMFLVVVAVFIYERWQVTPATFLAVPMFALLILNGFCTQIILGVLGARFRDIHYLVQTIMRVMFFLTPIFWLPQQMGNLMDILVYNPFLHFMEVVRAPVMDGALPHTSLMVVLGITVFNIVAALITMTFGRRRIVFWM